MRREDVQVVHVYKNLGVHPEDRLEWTKNTQALISKSTLLPAETMILQHLCDTCGVSKEK